MKYSNILIFAYDSLLPGMISRFGGKRPTPAFDYFAANGLTCMTAAHSLRTNVAMGAILTGLHPHNSGISTLKQSGDMPSTRKGYQKKTVTDLVTLAIGHSYRARLFNCDFVNSCMPKAAWHNHKPATPHLNQLESFIADDPEGPFLIVDRISSTAFPFSNGGMIMPSLDSKSYRSLVASLLKDKAARRIMQTIVGEIAKKENDRFRHIIDLLCKYDVLNDSIVIITGVPAGISEDENNALMTFAGREIPSPPLFPTIIHCPSKLPAGNIENRIVNHVDILPTIVSLSGIDVRSQYDGKDLTAKSPAALGDSPVTPVFYDSSITCYGNDAQPLLAVNSCGRPAPAEEGPSVDHLPADIPDSLRRPLENDRHLISDNVIPKTSVFVVAHPRGGTNFFDEFFKRGEFPNVKNFGHNFPSFHELNERYDEGLLSSREVKAALGKLKPLIMSIREEVFVSVNHDSFFILEELGEVFCNSKFIFISRDPRNVIRSYSSGYFNIQRRGGNSHKEAREVGRLNHVMRRKPAASWVDRMSYGYNAISRAYYNGVQTLGERAIIVKFEDIFSPEKRFPGIKIIADFLQDEMVIPTDDNWLDKVFSKKVHPFTYTFPHWDEWSPKDRDILRTNCGETMKLLGYDI